MVPTACRRSTRSKPSRDRSRGHLDVVPGVGGRGGRNQGPYDRPPQRSSGACAIDRSAFMDDSVEGSDVLTIQPRPALSNCKLWLERVEEQRGRGLSMRRGAREPGATRGSANARRSR